MALYCDTIPESAISRVIRFLSDRPRLPSWQRYVSPENVVTLTRLGGSFNAVALSTFTKVDSKTSGILHPSKNARVNAIMSSAAFTDLVSSLGSSITHLSLMERAIPKECARAVVSNCTELQHLVNNVKDAGGTLPIVVAARGAKLEVLGVTINGDLDRKTCEDHRLELP